LACNTWTRELEDIVPEVIELALKASLSKFAWMPSLGEFKSLCVSISKSPRFENTYKKSSNDIQSHINNQNVNTKRLIEEGATICKRLKKIFPDKHWMRISLMFGQLKNFERKMYRDMDDLKIILQLRDRDDDYLKEVFEQ